MKNILFRADSSSTIGTGHVMRDLVLASQYKDANIIFATQDLDANINHKIEEAGYKIELLKSASMDELNKLIKKLDINLLVIDHYGIKYEDEKQLKLKNSSLKILAFDDTYEKHYCNILLNHNISADESKYKDLVPKDCELRCGSKYTLLRDEFREKKKKEKLKIKNSSFKILIAMGGVDSRKLNIKILKVLEKFENIEIDIITTTANKNLDTLKSYVANFKNITLDINSSQVAKLMHKCDFAIVTPSVTVNEAYFMELPLIAVKTEDNQKDIYEYLQKNNDLVLEQFDALALGEKVDLMINKLNSQIINFTNLTLDEKRMILEWRNNDCIRKWMYNRDEISLENHLQYIDSLDSIGDRIYFLVKDETAYFGIVDLTELIKETSAELGVYANPELKGYGTLLMSKIIDYAFNKINLKTLYANAYTDNTRAINLYKKFNFKATSTTEDKNGKLQKMELKNENR